MDSTTCASAVARVRENPYRLAFNAWGILLLSADCLRIGVGRASGRFRDGRTEAGGRT